MTWEPASPPPGFAIPVDVGTSNAEGAASTLSRSDHVHKVPTAVPVAVGTANAEGVASTFARSDHVHQGALSSTSYGQITAITTTASLAFVDLLSVVHNASGGNLCISFSAGFSNTNDQNSGYFELQVDGVTKKATAAVVRNAGRHGTVAIVHRETVAAGARTVKIRWKTNSGTNTIDPVGVPDAHHASLLIMETSV